MKSLFVVNRTNVTNAPAVTGTNNLVTISKPDGANFFRLYRPQSKPLNNLDSKRP
jgi:hypothetical protein